MSERNRKNAQAYRERIQGTAKQQQSKLVRSEKKLTHARDGGFPTPTSAGKKTRKDEAWVTAERRRLDMPALTEEEKAKRGWRPAAARLSLPFSPPAIALIDFASRSRSINCTMIIICDVRRTPVQFQPVQFQVRRRSVWAPSQCINKTPNYYITSSYTGQSNKHLAEK